LGKIGIILVGRIILVCSLHRFWKSVEIILVCRFHPFWKSVEIILVCRFHPFWKSVEIVLVELFWFVGFIRFGKVLKLFWLNYFGLLVHPF
jgi:hypothetical protein